MSNHIHLICRAKEGFNLSEVVRDTKKFTSKKILKEIQTGLESRREWMLVIFKKRAKAIQITKNISYGNRTTIQQKYIQILFSDKNWNTFTLILFAQVLWNILKTISIQVPEIIMEGCQFWISKKYYNSLVTS